MRFELAASLTPVLEFPKPAQRPSFYQGSFWTLAEVFEGSGSMYGLQMAQIHPRSHSRLGLCNEKFKLDQLTDLVKPRMAQTYPEQRFQTLKLFSILIRDYANYLSPEKLLMIRINRKFFTNDVIIWLQ